MQISLFLSIFASFSYFGLSNLKQYNIIIENQEEIIKFNNKKISKYLLVWIIISSLMTTASFFLLGATLIPRIILGFSLASIFTAECAIGIKENNFKKELKQYVKYSSYYYNICRGQCQRKWQINLVNFV